MSRLHLALILCLIAAPLCGAEPARLDTHGDPLPPGARGRLGTVRLRHEQGADTLAFSPDGNRLVSGSSNCAIVWDVASGRQLLKVGTEKERNGFAAVFSPDGKELLTGDPESISVRDAHTGKILRELKDLEGATHYLVYSPDGKTLASCGWEGVIRLWDPQKATEKLRLQAPRCNVAGIDFAPGGKVLLSVGHDQTIRFWDLATGKEQRCLRFQHPVYSAGFSPDGKTLATCGGEKVVRLWDVKTGKQVGALEGHTHPQLAQVAYSPDGKLIASAGRDGSLRVWDAGTCKELWKIEGVKFAWSPDGKMLATKGRAGIRLWDVRTRQELCRREGHFGEITGLCCTPDGKTLASISEDRSILLWDTATNKVKGRIATPGGSRPLVDFSPDGKRLVSSVGLQAGRIQLWDLARPEKPVWSELMKSSVSRLAFTSDGAGVVFADGDSTAHRLDAATGKEQRCLYSGMGAVVALTGGPHGLLATASSSRSDSSVIIWDTATGRQRGSFTERRGGNLWGGADCLSLSPDGRRLFAAWGTSISIRSVETGKMLGRIELKSTALLRDLVCSPDGRLVASVHAGGAVHVHDVLTGKELQTFRAEEFRLWCAAFAPDSKTLATGGTGCAVTLWDMAPRGWERRTVVRADWRQLERWGAALEGSDGVAAYRAVWSLAAADNGVAYLRSQLPIAEELTDQEVRKLIANLDSQRFTTREAAMRRLRLLGTRAELALREALTKKPTLEMRRRIDELLERIAVTEEARPRGEELRQLRAVWALEVSGSAPARKLLHSVARGATRPRVAREAQLALGRLRG